MFITDKERNVMNKLNSFYALNWRSIFDNDISLEQLSKCYQTYEPRLFSKDYLEGFFIKETVLIHHIAMIRNFKESGAIYKKYAQAEYNAFIKNKDNQNICPIQSLQNLWLSHLLGEPNHNLEKQTLEWLAKNELTNETYHNKEFILIICHKALNDFLPGQFRKEFQAILQEISSYYEMPKSLNKIFIPEGVFRNKETDEYFYFNYPVMLDTRRHGREFTLTC